MQKLLKHIAQGPVTALRLTYHTRQQTKHYTLHAIAQTLAKRKKSHRCIQNAVNRKSYQIKVILQEK